MNDGGKAVDFYEISYSKDGGTYKVLEETWITGTSYTTAAGLVTQESYYSFMIRSVNSVGYSLYSDPLTIKAAQKPDRPAAPSTEMVDSDIRISWLAPNNRGQTIEEYIIRISAGDGIAYLTDASCNGALQTVVSA